MWSWFHFTVDDILLFQSWKIDTAWKMIISCIGIYLLGLLSEAIKLTRKKFHSKSAKSSLTTDNTTSMKHVCHQMSHVILFVLQLIINYLLMLIFMSYSVWLGTAVVLGITTGSYVFA